MKAFTARNDEFHEGFHMTFTNGFTISVQFGKHTRSDQGETTAEVAVWKDENWFILDENNELMAVDVFSNVMNNCTPETVAFIIGEIGKIAVEDEGPEFDSAGFSIHDR